MNQSELVRAHLDAANECVIQSNRSRPMMARDLVALASMVSLALRDLEIAKIPVEDKTIAGLVMIMSKYPGLQGEIIGFMKV